MKTTFGKQAEGNQFLSVLVPPAQVLSGDLARDHSLSKSGSKSKQSGTASDFLGSSSINRWERGVSGQSRQSAAGSVMGYGETIRCGVGRLSSFQLGSPEDLLDNETTQALRGTMTLSKFDSQSQKVLRILSEEGTGVVDWSIPKKRRKLKDLRMIVRNLFWAFGEVGKEPSCERKLPGWRRPVQQFVHSSVCSAFFLLLTLYALFGMDICQACGQAPITNYPLAVFNTVVLLLFVLEAVLFSIGQEGYFGGLRFWVDAFAALSIIGDTMVLYEVVGSNAAMASRGSRFIRLLGGRSTRIMRSSRIMRAFLRLQDLQLHKWGERGTSELALLLWRKRTRHVFQFLDKPNVGKLPPEEREFFNVAMMTEFAEDGELQARASSGRIGRVVGKMCCGLFSSRDAADPMKAAPVGSYDHMVKKLLATREGKKSLNRCFDDIQRLKESCKIVEGTIARITLKLSLVVLMMIVTVQILHSGDRRTDLSIPQGLAQLDSMARSSEIAPDEFCKFARDEYAKIADDSSLLLLILDKRLYWTPECPCCNASQVVAHSDLVTQDPCGDAGLTEAKCSMWQEPDEESLVGKMLQVTGREWHEHEVVIIEEGGTVRSMAMWDVHKAVRTSAMWSLAYTSAVIVLLVGLVAHFSRNVKHFSNHNVMYPLWDLVDDMCAMKSMEVLKSLGAEKRGRSSSKDSLVGVARRCTFHEDAVQETRKRRCCRLARLTACSSSTVMVSEEITQLRGAFDKLHVAMSSWSKYVPMVLLKQLFEASVEASLGCNFEEVCVFFCAISGFKEICDDMQPMEVLHLMSDVLGGIYDALDENGGVMLEFIGDEVLAVFNAPTRVSNYEVAAISAALEAQENVATVHNEPRIKLDCSVHKARVLAGNLGSHQRMKYGVLGDGVNLAARLKSLNSRFGTGILVSGDVLMGDVREQFVSRPVGNLVLKGRTTPTSVFEVLAKQGMCSDRMDAAAAKQTEAFFLFTTRCFAAAKALFEEAHALISESEEFQEWGSEDKLCPHLVALCDQYLASPPPEDWNGSEKLTKKAW